MQVHNQLFSLPSADIDQALGFEINQIEHQLFLRAKTLRPQGDLSNLSHVLHNGHQTWVGLDPQTLLTPYAELIEAADHLKPHSGQHFVDLGAGYGRLGLVLHHFYPGVKFTGYELVDERVVEGQRIFEKHGCTEATLYSQDLTAENFVIPEADFYFLYDYGKVSHIRQTLKQLEERAFTSKFKIIARGKGSRSIIEHEHPWLSQIYPVYRQENYSIYSMSL
jgi:hypothetical protein